MRAWRSSSIVWLKVDAAPMRTWCAALSSQSVAHASCSSSRLVFATCAARTRGSAGAAATGGGGGATSSFILERPNSPPKNPPPLRESLGGSAAEAGGALGAGAGSSIAVPMGTGVSVGNKLVSALSSCHEAAERLAGMPETDWHGVWACAVGRVHEVVWWTKST